MPRIEKVTPRVSVKLYKSISRKVGKDGGLPVSQRYADREAFIDLTPFLGDGSQVQVQKSVKQIGGGCTITFSDKPNVAGQKMGPVLSTAGLESIIGLVEPMDLLEIRMWRGIGECPNPMPIKMRAFVSKITRRRTMGGDGKPVRTITLSGLDYGSLMQMYQLLYIGSYAGSPAFLSGFNLMELIGEDAINTISGEDFLKLLMDKAINPLLDNLLPKTSPLPRTIEVDASATGNLGTAWQQNEGSIADLLMHSLDTNYWNELFVEDREDGVYLVWRPCPYFDLITGKSTQPIRMPDFVQVPDGMIVDVTQERDHANIGNFTWVSNSQFDLIGDQFRLQDAVMGQANNTDRNERTYPNTNMDYYGLRAVYAETSMTSPDMTNIQTGPDQAGYDERNQQGVDWVNSRREILINNRKDNVVMESGSITMKGGPMRDDGSCMKPGDYVHVLDGLMDWSAYCITMTDNFVPYRSYTTSIDYDRGTGFAARTAETGGNSPWLKEQATRQTDTGKQVDAMIDQNKEIF